MSENDNNSKDTDRVNERLNEVIEKFKNAKAIKIEEKPDGSITFEAIQEEKKNE